ncbi:MAG: type ISP restriction/modification enzyme, partial [Terriglobales bacterium]
SATAETSYYPPLDRLLNAAGQKLKPVILFSTQLRNQGAGMPDGGFFPQPKRSRRNAEPAILQNPERGVVEIKPADYNLDTLTHEPQTLRYLKQYGLVLITNLREFRLLQLTSAGTVQTLERYTLAPTPAALWSDPLTHFNRHADLLPDFLARVMLYRAPLVQPKDVAWLLASYAREARARAEDHPLGSFRTVKLALQESLGIQFEGEKGEHFFRSTLVQTLFYGIFSAWILWRRVPENRAPGARFDWRVSAHYLRVPVLRKLFGEVSDPGALNSVQLQEILNLAGEALNRVQRAFFEIFREEEAVAYFYEPFLEAFDPELRKDLGVWYTPKEIVRYMVERVDYLLRTELDQPLGLASGAVRILDPCCGTGAYLTAVLNRIHQTLLENAGDDTALVPDALRTVALTRVFGFEIMPAPFVIAHLQLASLLENAGAPLTDDHRAGVYLTNALTGWVPEKHPQSEIFEEFKREREDSEQIKQHGPILVILGNPPYNGYAGIAKIEEERDLTNEYRTPVEGLPAPQGQGLNDLYIRFFRIAERRIADNAEGKGIVSFISNYSWLDGLSHTTMRHHYLQTFADIYIDNLHGDRKITEYAPDGRTSETVFAITGTSVGIRIGTAISTLVRNAQSGSRPAALYYRDFEDARASERRESLTRSIATHEPHYASLVLNSTLGLPFKPRVVETEYLAWPRLPELFPVSFPGIKTSRDSLVVDIDRDRLEARMKRYFNPDISNEEFAQEIPEAMEDGYMYTAKKIRAILQERGFRTWEILRYCYRPFDTRWIYWEPETSLLRRKVEEYVRGAIFPSDCLVTQQKSRGESSPPQLIKNVGCLDLLDRSASCFPSVVINSAGTLLSTIEIHPNLSPDAEAYRESLSAGAAPHRLDIFYHALAATHAPAYRAENSGALMSDWPRIPLPATADLLAHSATLGRRLAELLDPESSIRLVAEWSFLAALKIPKNSDVGNALKLTAGWGYRGQGSTVMPGQGLAPERQWSAVEKGKLAALAAAPSLTSQEVLTLLGESCVDVHLNGESFWPAVPINVWNYTLGGYQVLKKWLSYREFPLLGRPLHSEEANYFAQVVRRIAAILLLGPALDASYQAIIPTAGGLPRP